MADLFVIPLFTLRVFFYCVFQKSPQDWLDEASAEQLHTGSGPDEVAHLLDFSWPRLSFVDRSEGKPPLPTKNVLAEMLHERISGGQEEAAKEALAVLFFQPLIRWLSKKFPKVDGTLIATGAADAIMEYLHHPEHFEPRRGGMEQFLRCVAWRNIADFLRCETRRQHRQDEAIAELRRISRSSMEGDTEPQTDEMIEARRTAMLEQFERFLKTLKDEDRKVMEVWLKGRRHLSEFVSVLDIDQLPAMQQKLCVFRVKDRLRKAARRWVLRRATASS